MKTSFFLLLTLGASYSQAQNTLHGKVTDASTQEPVAGAAIYIHELKKGGVTNADGHYSIDKLPKGKFIVESKLIGYASRVELVAIDGETEFNFILNGVVTELEEVVVTGISHTTELKNNPASVSTINSKTLIENSTDNLIGNISKRPGLSQITTGSAIAKPVIRGLSFNRIITLYDGIRQEGQQWGDEHGIEIDEFSVDRVEIVKGPGSLMYGSDGIGGVLNFLPGEPLPEGNITGNIYSNYQTNNGLFANSLANAGNLNGLYWSARITNKVAHAYKNAFDGWVFNSGFNETAWNGLIGYSSKWGYSQFSISNFRQHVGLVEGERDDEGNFTREINDNGSVEEIAVQINELKTYELFVPNQFINHFKIYNTSNVYLGESRFQINAGYQRNKRKEFGNVIHDDDADLFFDLTTLNYNLIYFLPESVGWSVSIGTGGMIQQNKNKGEEFLIPEYRLMDLGVFSFLKKHFDRLTVAGGLRYDQRNISIDALYLDDEGVPTDNTDSFQKFTQAELSFSNFSASAGITYEISQYINVKTNFSRGFRAPNISELSSNGQHEGSLRYEYGNYSLKPETSLQGDFSISINNEHITAELSLYKNLISNFIYAKKLLASGGGDSIPDPQNPSPAFQYIQGKASLYGGEFVLDIHPHPLDWLHIEQSLSAVRGDNRSAGVSDESKYLPFIPAPRYQAEIRSVFKRSGKSLRDFYAKVEFDYNWKQAKVLLENGTETPTPAYGLWNAGVGGQINSRKSELFKFYITVNNLFDKAYQNHLNRLKYAAENPITGRTGVFNMGRNVSFKILVPMTFKRTKN